MIDINLRPDQKVLKQFGLIAVAGFALLGGLVFWRNGLFGLDFGATARPVAYSLWGIAGLSGLFSMVAPRANLPLYVGLTVLTYPIGYVVSHVIMGLVFFGMLTPLALIFRLIGRDILHRRFDQSAKSYWSDWKPAKDTRRYFRQF